MTETIDPTTSFDDIEDFIKTFLKMKQKHDEIFVSNESLQENYEQLKKDLESAERTITSLKKGQEILLKAVADGQNSHLKLHKLQEEKSSLEKTIDGLLLDQAKQKSNHASELALLKSKHEREIYSAKDDIKSLKKKLETESYEISLLRKRLGEKEIELNNLKNISETDAYEVSLLKKRLTDKENELNNLKKDVEKNSFEFSLFQNVLGEKENTTKENTAKKRRVLFKY